MQRIAADKTNKKKSITAINKKMIVILFSYLKPYKTKLIVSFLAMFIVTGCAVLGPYLTKIAIDNYIIPGNQKGLLLIFLLMILTYGVSWYGSYLQRFQSALLGQGVIKDIRSDLYEHILKLSQDFYVKEDTGQIISRITNDVESLSDLVSMGIVFLINDVLTLAGIIAIMIYLDFDLALVTMIIIPVTIIIFYFLGKKMRKAYQQIRIKIAALYTFVEESISGIRVVQSLLREEENLKQFMSCSRENMKANLKSVSVFGFFFPTVNLTGVIGTGLVLWYGGLQVIQGDISLGVLIAFLGYISRFFIPLRDLSQIYNTYQAAFAAMERIYEYLNLKPTVQQRGSDNNKNAALFPAAVEINNVYFKYNKNEKYYNLKNINLSIKSGEVIAVVGSSGAGKTTVTRLLTRLYDVDKGEILFSGKNICSYSFENLRNLIGMVTQDTYLFPGTIKDNISYGDPKAEDEKIIEASKIVLAHNFISNLKDGYETQVGEGGVRLSGGQKQLISFARVMLKNPRILILDEATSNVDAGTEKMILKAMENLFKNKTVIMIAHRFKTIEIADRIVVLNNGIIHDIGTQDRLLDRNDIYKKLYYMQK